MESSHLVIFSTSGKFITKFNVLRCISLSEALFWTGAKSRIPITLTKLQLKKIQFKRQIPSQEYLIRILQEYSDSSISFKVNLSIKKLC